MSIIDKDNTKQIAVQASKEEIKFALKTDPEFLINFFIADELLFPVPKFHIEIFLLMISGDVRQLAIAVPRDHAKTTLAKLACVWYFLFSDYRFILYQSLTVGIAIPSVNDIIKYMQCDNFIAVFGQIKFKSQQDGKGIYSFWLDDKFCILRAFGAGMQVRGINVDDQRPELAIVDDIEDVNNAGTSDLFLKLKRWFYGPFKKALDKFDRKIIHIGNLTENQSLIAEHCRSRFWNSRVYGCLLKDSQPLWPDAWSIEKLRNDYLEYAEAGQADVWFAEMMNMPTAGGRGIIRAEEIYFQPFKLKEDIEFGCITIDLAISEKTWAHKTVIAAHGFIPDGGINGIWQAIDYEGFHGIDPIPLFWKVIEMCKRWHISVVGIESVAYQAALKSVFEHECLRNGITGIEFVQLQAIGRKPQRIITWASMIKAKTYALNEGDFIITQELLTYRPDKKENNDDHIDACAYLPQMLDKFMHLIMQEYRVNTHNEIQGSYQICEV